MRIYVTGVSGTGKSSVARSIKGKGITSIDIDEGLCRWENKYSGKPTHWEPGKNAEWHASHQYICDIERLKKLLSENEDVVVVGLASNQHAFFNLFDKIYLLKCSPETYTSRIQKRTDNDFGKHQAEQELLLNWQKVLEVEMDKEGVTLDAGRPLEEVVNEIYANF